MNSSGRLVIVLAGPPGAGKSTWALAADLEVVSWESVGRHEAAFWHAIASVAADVDARVVVERPGALIAHREAIAQACGADAVYVLAPSFDVVVERIMTRGRRAWQHEIVAAHEWFDAYQPHPGHPGPPQLSSD